MISTQAVVIACDMIMGDAKRAAAEKNPNAAYCAWHQAAGISFAVAASGKKMVRARRYVDQTLDAIMKIREQL